MRILGIDPGLATLGYGVIEADRGNYKLIQYGTVTTPAGQPMPARLSAIYRGVSQLMEIYQPDEVAFEELGECVSVPEDTSAEELCALLDSFLEQTPTLDRQLFLGRYWFAHSVRVLAKHYELTENAVSQRLKRTRAALKSYLNERGYGI